MNHLSVLYEPIDHSGWKFFLSEVPEIKPIIKNKYLITSILKSYNKLKKFKSKFSIKNEKLLRKGQKLCKKIIHFHQLINRMI